MSDEQQPPGLDHWGINESVFRAGGSGRHATGGDTSGLQPATMAISGFARNERPSLILPGFRVWYDMTPNGGRRWDEIVTDVERNPDNPDGWPIACMLHTRSDDEESRVMRPLKLDMLVSDDPDGEPVVTFDEADGPGFSRRAWMGDGETLRPDIDRP